MGQWGDFRFFQRRRFLQAGALVVAGPWLLSACGGGNRGTSDESNRADSPTENGAADATPGSDGTWDDPVPVLQKKGLLIGPGRIADEAGKRHYYLALLDLDAATLKARLIEMSFFGHGVTPDPVEPQKAVIFEKKGPGACEVDLKTGKVLRTIPTVSGRHFYGHGAFSLDGKLLYSTEAEIDNAYRGVIVVRDGRTFEVLGTFPTFGTAPHDCRMVQRGKTLAITNGGSPIDGDDAPCVTFVDIESEKLIEKVPMGTPRINTGHLALTSQGDLAVVSAPRDGLQDQEKQPGGISLRPAGGTLKTLAEPADLTARMVGETLSVAIHEPTGTVAATNPMGNLVTFWDLKTGKSLKTLELDSPRGVALTLDQQEFVISFGNPPAILRLKAETLEEVAGSRFDEAWAAGSHIVMYDLPA